MRIHLVAGVLAGSFAALAPLSAAERALIILCTALVVSAEAANTALEALVDLHGGPPTDLGRIAKDAAAGAVLVLAAASVLVFAVVAGGHLRELARSWRGLLPPAVAAAGLTVVTVLLLVGGAPWDRAVMPLTVIGVILVTLLCATAAHGAVAVVPGCLFSIAVAASRRGGSRSRR